MSTTATRLLALPFGLAAIVLDIVGGLSLPSWTATSVLLVAVGVPLGVFLLLCRPWRPGAVVSDGSHVVIPRSPASAAVAVVAFGVGGSGIVQHGRFAVDSADAAALVFFGVLALIAVFWPRPRLVLDPDGVSVVRHVATERLAWADLASVRVDRGNLDVNYRNGSREAISLLGFHLSPAIVAAHLQRYIEHPEERASIGVSHGTQ